MPATPHLAPAAASRRATALAAVLLAVAGLCLAACGSSGSDDDADAKASAFEMRPVTALTNTVSCSVPSPSNKPTEPVTLCNGANQKVTLGPAVVGISDVSSVKAATGKGKQKGPVVAVTLTKEGKQRLAQSTAGLAVNAPPLNTIAILSNGTIVAAPNVTQPIAGGVVQLGGIDKKTTAQTLAAQIRAGIPKQ